MPTEVGSMVCQSLFFDWLIPDFLNWAKSKSAKDFFTGPDFIIHGKTFWIGLYPNGSAASVKVLLGNHSENPLFVDRFSFSLVSDDGSELDIGSETEVTFKKKYLDVEDATFQKTCLQPKFLPNGELCIRCRIDIGQSKEIRLRTPIQERSIADDLSQQFAVQSLSFTDTILSCGEKEIPVHRFMLAARSPVFNAMFSHEETLESSEEKVEK
jgi:hypothetical protein